jgi:hypothetical protein
MKTQSSLTARFIALFAFSCFAVSQIAEAVNPPPGGGYPGGNTAEGTSALLSLTSGTYNTAVGIYSLLGLTDGSFNTAIGAGTLLLNGANENTAIGAAALFSNVGGSSNTATGAFALFSNTGTANAGNPNGVFFGSFNTAVGDRALFTNTNGNTNTAIGAGALTENTTGSSNTAVGISALSQNSIAGDNTAIGAVALFNNSTGSQNTATGTSALSSNTSGDRNTATGWQALFSNAGANNNTADGFQALQTNTNGGNNTGIGFDALLDNVTGSANTAVGANALANVTGSGNVALGENAGVAIQDGDNNIHIGNSGASNDTETIRIGLQGTQTQTFIAGIRGATTGVANAVNVLIDSNGQLGTMNSSRRFKHKIKPMENASESILALKPVTFCYKNDKTDTSQFGLIAEEVAAANPDLVVRDDKGEIFTVRYDAVNAMLLNEFLKEHARGEAQDRKIQKQEETIAQLKKDLEVLVSHLKEQDSKILRVSEKVD